MYFDYYGLTGGSDVAGVASPQVTSYLAEGCTASPFDTWVLLMNPAADSVRVRMQFMTADGSSVADHWEVVAPHSRKSVRLCDLPGLASASFSTTVSCPDGGSVVVERAMYFDWQGRTGGHANAAAASASTVWNFAEGYTGD